MIGKFPKVGPRVYGGGSAYGPLTNAYASTVGITSPTILNALNELEKNLKGTGTSSTYDFYGNDHLIYVYPNRGASQLGAETDFLATYNGTAFNSPSYTNNGVVFDGVNDYINTGFILNSLGNEQRTGALGYYKSIGAGTWVLGAAQDPDKYNGIALSYSGNSSTSYFGSDNTSGIVTSDNATDGVRGGMRLNSNDLIVQVKDTQSTFIRAFGAHPLIQDVRGALNYSTNGNIIAHKACTEVILMRFKGDINASRLTTLKNVLNQFVTDLGI